MNARLAAAALLAGSLFAQGPEQVFIDSFEQIWTTVRDKHWDPGLGGVDWQAVHDELRPKIEKAENNGQARRIMTDMLDRLKLSHFQVIPGLAYDGLGAGNITLGGDGETGMDVRLIDGKVVVSSLTPDSPAARAGVQRGWIIQKIDSRDLGSFLKTYLEHSQDSSLRDLTVRRAVNLRLSSLVGETTNIEFTNGTGWPVSKQIGHQEPRGRLTTFGFLGPAHVWLDARRLNAGGKAVEYIAFNLFLDPARLMDEFGAAVGSCLRCDGMIIDLRGNPGGLGAMASGMAGWFFEKKGLRLGTLYLRETALKFVINSRAETYGGPLAILVDSTSASTAEIMAGGLQDLKRARIFGSRTAGAALPSVIERLPNGDAFQYAIANYVSEGGQELEGHGVVPDEVTPLTREALLAGKDPALDAAMKWIQGFKAEK